MAENDKSEDTPPAPPIKKKPYIKPAFRFEKVFVTSALSCGKTSNLSLQCNSNTKVS
jgi:hypothetical protein